jgi:hypothetical protein
MITYLLIGTIWALLFELKVNTGETTMGTRFRQLLLWPIPVGAWIIGFSLGMIQVIDDFIRRNF